MIAPYLTSLQERLKPHGIQVGSYPVLGEGVFVSLIGRDLGNGINTEDGQGKLWLADVAREVEREVGGRVVSEEEIAKKKEERLTPDEKPVQQQQQNLSPKGSGEGVKAKY